MLNMQSLRVFIKKRKYKIAFFIVIICVAMCLAFYVRQCNCKDLQPCVGICEEYIASNGVIVQIERIPDPPFAYNSEFVVDTASKRFAYTSYNLKPSFTSSQAECSVVVDGVVIGNHKRTINYHLTGFFPMSLGLSFDLSGMLVKYCVNSQVYVDGKIFPQRNGCDVADMSFLPGNSVVYYLKNGTNEYIEFGDVLCVINNDKPHTVIPLSINSSLDTVTIAEMNNEVTVYHNDSNTQQTVTGNLPFLFGNVSKHAFDFYIRNVNHSSLNEKTLTSYIIRCRKDKSLLGNVTNLPYHDKLFTYICQRKHVRIDKATQDVIGIIQKEEDSFEISLESKKLGVFYFMNGEGIPRGTDYDSHQLTLFGCKNGCYYRIKICNSNNTSQPMICTYCDEQMVK